MSSILSAPPQRIPIAGQGGDAPTGPMPGVPGGSPGAEGGAGAQPDGPDMPGVKKALQAATDNLMQAAQLEGDDADKATIMQLVAKVHSLVAGHQQLADQAMGAGPGVKLVRKAGSNGAGGGY